MNCSVEKATLQYSELSSPEVGIWLGSYYFVLSVLCSGLFFLKSLSVLSWK